jgi:hypothetical protein
MSMMLIKERVYEINMGSQEILGMLFGLTEAWGRNVNDWDSKQKGRIMELFQILHRSFIIEVMDHGSRIEKEFLADLSRQLFGNGDLVNK